MARPRVFISSTYYDLRVLRADLARNIKDLGYEPVLFERGHVPYGKGSPLEDYCYKEIATCDIVVNIIGGKLGTLSRDGDISITQKELKKALDAGKQVYVFIEKAVLNEFRTWQVNKEVSGFKPSAVNDVKIYRFIDEIYTLPSGNPIEGFETSDDIVHFLREQFAGLFQALIAGQSRQKELNVIESLNSTVATLNQLVGYLTAERSKGDATIKDILLSSHPAFAALRKSIKIPYRIIFYDVSELEALLTARQWEAEIFTTSPGFHEYINPKLKLTLLISSLLFDEHSRLKAMKPEEWDEDYIRVMQLPQQEDPQEEEIPF